MNTTQILIEKNGIVISKEKDNDHFLNIMFDIENNNLDITKLLNIDFFKLIYDLNYDIFESLKVEKKNENEANFFILCKDLFVDIGFPQFYYYFNIKKETEENDRIKFIFTTLDNPPPALLTGLKSNILLVPLQKCDIVFYIKSISSVKINLEIFYNPPAFFSTYFEKMVNTILFKVFNRVKQFIYNIK